LNVLDVRSFRAADCDSDYYLVVAKVRERLAVNKHRSHRFHMERFKLLDQRKQAKLQLLQNPSEINGDNLNIVGHEASRYFRNKKRECLKDKINELATRSKNKNIRDLHRGINEFKRGYQPRNHLVKVENGDLLADSHKF
jgi:hypothetical protein